MNAGMAFFAFVDTLFVALSGPLPGAAAGASRILEAVGVRAAVVVLRAAMLRRGDGAPSCVSLPLLALTAAVCAAQVMTARSLLQSPSRAWAENDLCGMLVALLVVGILRSWELLGMGRSRLASLYGWKRARRPRRRRTPPPRRACGRAGVVAGAPPSRLSQACAAHAVPRTPCRRGPAHGAAEGAPLRSSLRYGGGVKASGPSRRPRGGSTWRSEAALARARAARP
jgi:hypothetical protein